MKTTTYCLFAFVLQVFISNFNCHAGEKNCVLAFGKAVTYSEVAAEAAQNNDACRAASGIEMALNWAGTAEKECAYDSSKLKTVREFKKQLIPLLSKYVKKCGH
jgi:hypothetical protein